MKESETPNEKKKTIKVEAREKLEKDRNYEIFIWISFFYPVFLLIWSYHLHFYLGIWLLCGSCLFANIWVSSSSWSSLLYAGNREKGFTACNIKLVTKITKKKKENAES